MAKKNWTDDKTTNKIYASGNVSALSGNSTVADTIGRYGVSPVQITTLNPEDKAADKYYANGGSMRVRTGTKTVPTNRQTPKSTKTSPTVTTGDLAVRQRSDIAEVLRAVLMRLRTVAEVVTVSVIDSDMLKQFRTAMDMAVSREELSSDDYYRVTLQFLPKIEKQEVVPTVVDTLPDPVAAEDPLDFLKPEVESQVSPVIEPDESISNTEDEEDATPVINPLAEVSPDTSEASAVENETPTENETPVEATPVVTEVTTKPRKRR